MAGSQVPPKTIEAYRCALYRVADPESPLTLRVDEPSAPLAALMKRQGAASAAFITASNPQGRKTPAEQNRLANQELLEEIQARGWAHFPGMGEDPKGQWPGEPSFLVLGLSLGQARDLGLKYGQNALVFAGADGLPRLVLLR